MTKFVIMLAAAFIVPLIGSSKGSSKGSSTKIMLNHAYFSPARHIGHQGDAQGVLGPMQDDEALLLYALVRTSQVRRVLEIGGLGGFSALTFVSGMHLKPDAAVYTIDVNKVPRRHERHHVLNKKAEHIRPEDIGGVPLDLIFLDCHVYNATREMVRRLLAADMLSRSGYIVLHDTGLHKHPATNGRTRQGKKLKQDIEYVAMEDGSGLVHQPVERLLADWIQREYRDQHWQRISVHDDARDSCGRPPDSPIRHVAQFTHLLADGCFRHGLTIMQRKVSLRVPAKVCKDIAGADAARHSLCS